MARANSRSRNRAAAPAGALVAAPPPEDADDPPSEVESAEADTDAPSEAVDATKAANKAKITKRGENIYSEKYDAELGTLYSVVEGAFEDKNQQDINIKRFWNVYNCVLTPNQVYAGTSQVYLPIIHDAIEARVQRFANTLFPEEGRYSSVLSNVPNKIRATEGLLDHYVRRAKLRSLTKEILRNAEVEGQISLYVEWAESTRYITKKVEKHPEISPGVHDPNTTFMDAEDDEIVDAHPAVEIIGAQDLAVVPPTFSDIETDAEVVAIRRWYTKDAVQKAIDDGLFDKELGEGLLKSMGERDAAGSKNPAEEKLDSAGVKWRAGNSVLMAYEVWSKIEVEGKRRWCKMYFGGPSIVLGMFVNPNWNDRCSVISKAVTKIPGSGWGKSKIDATEQLQYMANDWANMAGDSGMYSLLPIVMTDPEKNPLLATMVMNLAAVWQTNPNDTKVLEFPQIWEKALEFAEWCAAKVFQSFGLNPAMMPTGTASKKQTQADTAQDQAVALASITDEVSTLEEDIFTPLLQRFFELDQQHRDDDLTIKLYGQMGIDAKMEKVPPFAWDDRYEISWRGSQIFKSAQQTQQMIAGMNILRSLPPVLPNGSRIDLTPIIQELVQNLFGARMGSKVLVDVRDQMSMPQQLENQLMMGGVMALVHPMDDDIQHIQETMAGIQMTGDPNGLMAQHLQMHQAQLAQKNQMMQMQMQGAEGLPGAPGGMKQPGIAGTPRPGAQPSLPRGGQNPPGAIHADRMQDAGRNPAMRRGQG